MLRHDSASKGKFRFHSTETEGYYSLEVVYKEFVRDYVLVVWEEHAHLVSALNALGGSQVGASRLLFFLAL